MEKKKVKTTLFKQLTAFIKSIFTSQNKNLIYFIPISALAIIISGFLYYNYKNRPITKLNLFKRNNGFIVLIKKNREIKNLNSSKRCISNTPPKKFNFPSGVTNYGNNCYINSLFQVLVNNKIYSAYLR